MGRRLFTAVLLLLTSHQLHASPLTDELWQLVEQGQLKQAFQRALPHLEDLAGDPDFDLAFGISAIDNGRISEGVFALERVLYLQPNHHRARLEYARGLFILGEDGRSRQAFEQVLADANPPPSVREKIDTYLQALRRRESRYQTSARGYVALGLGYDSNINSAPENQLSLIQLSPQSLGRSDPFSRIQFGGQAFFPQTKHSTYYGRWDSNIRVYQDEEEQNSGNHSLVLGGQWNQPGFQFDLSANLQRYRLDDAGYRTLFGPTAQWHMPLHNDLALQTSVSLLFLNYDDAAIRDSRQEFFNLRLLGNLDLPLTPTWFTGVFVGDEHSDAQSPSSKASVDRRLFGASAGGQINISRNWSLTAATTAQHSEYDGRDLFYNNRRRDTYYALDLELKHLFATDWQWTLGANASKNSSNIELYDYRRKQATLSIRYAF